MLNLKLQLMKLNSRKESKFKSLILDKDFEPAKNLDLEELTEDTKYMEEIQTKKTLNLWWKKEEKFSYCHCI